MPVCTLWHKNKGNDNISVINGRNGTVSWPNTFAFLYDML